MTTKAIELACIFCDIKSEDTVIVENGYEGRQCPQCGLIYTSPRPSFDDIVDLYGHDLANISAQTHIAHSDIKRLYARHNLRLLRRFIRSGALLEIGAGAGDFVHEARKSGFQPNALEFNPIQADHIRTELDIPCEQSPLDNTVFDGKRFDLLYHCDVLSHFYEPIVEFQKMHEILNDKGYLVFETGNLGDVEKRFYRYIDRFQLPDHLFFFSEANLTSLLEENGFELVAIHRYSIVPQLLVMGTLRKIVRFLKRGKAKSSASAGRATEHDKISGRGNAGRAGNRSLSYRQLTRKLENRFVYFLRYYLGSLAPRRGRPQTVLVIARKTRAADNS